MPNRTPSKRLTIPLSRDQVMETQRNIKDERQNNSSYSISALNMLVRLAQAGITDGLQPFFIDGDEYTPPPFRVLTRHSVLRADMPIDLLDQAEPYAEKDVLTLPQYVAKAIGLRNDLIDFDAGRAFMANNGEARLPVTI